MAARSRRARLCPAPPGCGARPPVAPRRPTPHRPCSPRCSSARSSLHRPFGRERFSREFEREKALLDRFWLPVAGQVPRGGHGNPRLTLLAATCPQSSPTVGTALLYRGLLTATAATEHVCNLWTVHNELAEQFQSLKMIYFEKQTAKILIGG